MTDHRPPPRPDPISHFPSWSRFVATDRFLGSHLVGSILGQAVYLLVGAIASLPPYSPPPAANARPSPASSPQSSAAQDSSPDSAPPPSPNRPSAVSGSPDRPKPGSSTTTSTAHQR